MCRFRHCKAPFRLTTKTSLFQRGVLVVIICAVGKLRVLTSLGIFPPRVVSLPPSPFPLSVCLSLSLSLSLSTSPCLPSPLCTFPKFPALPSHLEGYAQCWTLKTKKKNATIAEETVSDWMTVCCAHATSAKAPLDSPKCPSTAYSRSFLRRILRRLSRAKGLRLQRVLPPACTARGLLEAAEKI